MKKIDEIDFSALSAKEKVEFVSHFQDLAGAGFQGQPFFVQFLAETLIFTRWWNSYKYMAPNEAAPEALETGIERMWDLLEGKCTPKAFGRFQKSLSDCALKICTGDGEGLDEDPESLRFYAEYFWQWSPESFYTPFLMGLCTALEEAACGKVSWDAVEEVLDRDIGDVLIDFFETVYKKDSGLYHALEMRRRERELYDTPTFARVIALLQRDMRAALGDADLPALQRQYRGEYLFSPEESAKIWAGER